MVEKGNIFWEGGVDSERVAHINRLKRGVYSGREGRFWDLKTLIYTHIYTFVEKGGIFWEGGVDSGRVAHINWLKRGIYSGREG